MKEVIYAATQFVLAFALLVGAAVSQYNVHFEKIYSYLGVLTA